MKTALSGLQPWLVQRFTALYMLAFIVLALGRFAVNASHSYLAWRAWMSGPWMLVTTALFFLALLLHAWVGMRDVVLDYVKPVGLRVGVLAALGFTLVGLALWALRILWSAQY